ncbi:SpoVR family protein [Sporomusa aerivorans]|uniref:SpoVR family protein n=1 Tax=Sporomusa aerivorans TaxID=204936 RepID=UPI00352B4249
MTDYTLAELAAWNEKIESKVREFGLDSYEQHFEICSYEDMLCYEAYVGMPSHYPHWSFGKAYERQKTFYQYNLSGLPYEMVINSDPCLAYLMRDNTLLLQILTMAHVYGHNDFFKNNRLFKRDTRAELTLEMFKAHADRVRAYVDDPSIGPEKVEHILDAAHALKFQVSRTGAGEPCSRRTLEQEKAEAVPGRIRHDLLAFLGEKGRLDDWERDLVNIVHAESLYFIPQIETKIMNEGWASYWHYQILKQLELPQGLYLEFLQRHNLVIRPHQQQLNPYFVGFKLFEYLDKTLGRERIMAIRAEDRDQSFIRRYLNQEMCREMNLFAYDTEDDYIVVSEVADDAGWKAVRDQLANSVGMGGIPAISPQEVDKGDLILEHDFEGRELELEYAQETIKYVARLWGGGVKIRTKLDGKDKVIACNQYQEIIIT